MKPSNILLESINTETTPVATTTKENVAPTPPSLLTESINETATQKGKIGSLRDLIPADKPLSRGQRFTRSVVGGFESLGASYNKVTSELFKDGAWVDMAKDFFPTVATGNAIIGVTQILGGSEKRGEAIATAIVPFFRMNRRDLTTIAESVKDRTEGFNQNVYEGRKKASESLQERASARLEGVDGFWADVGGVIPSTAALGITIAGSAFIPKAAPVLTKGYLAHMGIASMGQGYMTYDDYAKSKGKQPAEDGMRHAVALTYAGSELLAEKLLRGVTRYLPKRLVGDAGRGLDGRLGDWLTKQVLASPAGKESMESAISKFAKDHPSKYQNFVKGLFQTSDKAMMEGLEESATATGQFFIDNYLVREIEDRGGVDELASRVGEAFKGGVYMAGMLSPMTISLETRDQNARREEKGLLIGVTNDGQAFEILEQRGDIIAGETSLGEKIEVLAEKVIDKAHISNEEYTSYRKGLLSTIEQQAVEKTAKVKNLQNGDVNIVTMSDGELGFLIEVEGDVAVVLMPNKEGDVSEKKMVPVSEISTVGVIPYSEYLAVETANLGSAIETARTNVEVESTTPEEQGFAHGSPVELNGELGVINIEPDGMRLFVTEHGVTPITQSDAKKLRRATTLTLNNVEYVGVETPRGLEIQKEFLTQEDADEALASFNAAYRGKREFSIVEVNSEDTLKPVSFQLIGREVGFPPADTPFAGVDTGMAPSAIEVAPVAGAISTPNISREEEIMQSIPLKKDGTPDYAKMDREQVYIYTKSVHGEGAARKDLNDEIATLSKDIQNLDKKIDKAPVRDRLSLRDSRSTMVAELGQLIELRNRGMAEVIQPQAYSPPRKEREFGSNVDKLRDKFNSFPRIKGGFDRIVLPNGNELSGSYYLVNAESLSPSHDPVSFSPTEGFPTVDGKTVNDRDYFNDKDAQQIIILKAANYDSRAVQDPVVVSSDGIVVSGNDRTMSGQLAAYKGTDGKYISYIKQQAYRFGLTQEDVESIDHPRIVFIPDTDIPYTTESFAVFNVDEKKTQNKEEKAIKIGKIIPDATIRKLATVLDGHDKLSDVYASEDSVRSIIGILLNDNIITPAETIELKDGNLFSPVGKDFFETVLLGSALQETTIRQLNNMRSIRTIIASAIVPLISNKNLNDYSLIPEVENGINLLYLAFVETGSVPTNLTIEGVLRQPTLGGDFETQSLRDFDKLSQYIAKSIILGQVLFKKIIIAHNSRAKEAAAGQVDLYSGQVLSKEEILEQVLKELNYVFRTFESGQLQDANILGGNDRGDTRRVEPHQESIEGTSPPAVGQPPATPEEGTDTINEKIKGILSKKDAISEQTTSSLEGWEVFSSKTKIDDAEKEIIKGVPRVPQLKDLPPGSMGTVEVQFSRDKNFVFSGKNKIESLSDVAYIFKNLQDSAIENAFAMLVDKDGNGVAVHLSMGTRNSTLIDYLAIANAINQFKPTSVYLVHNHPSGNLTFSQADIALHQSIKNVFGDIIKEHIIINLASGEYSTFNTGSDLTISQHEDAPEDEYQYSVVKFDKQAFASPTSLGEITNAGDVAKFISAQRFTQDNKLSILILSSSGEIRGYLHYPAADYNTKDGALALGNYILENTARFGGVSVIITSNDPAIILPSNQIKEVKKRLAPALTILDEVYVKAPDDYISSASLKDFTPATGYTGNPEGFIHDEELAMAIEEAIAHHVKSGIASFEEISSTLIEEFSGEIIPYLAPAYKKVRESSPDAAMDSDRVVDSLNLPYIASRDIISEHQKRLSEGAIKREEIQLAVQEVDPNPSEEQKKAGNYAKGHISLLGVNITIENPKGSVRRGVSKSGENWESTLYSHYGYIKRTEGSDGDQVDVFVGDDVLSERIFVIDQIDPKTGTFDEHKVMIGFTTKDEASENYFMNYEPGWDGMGAITELSKDEFSAWVKNPDRVSEPLIYGELTTNQRATLLKRIQEIDAAIAAATKKRKSAVAAKNKKIQEINDRNSLFETAPVDTPLLFAGTYTLTQEAARNALIPFESQIAIMDKELQRLATLKSQTLKVGGMQGDLFAKINPMRKKMEPSPEEIIAEAAYDAEEKSHYKEVKKIAEASSVKLNALVKVVTTVEKLPTYLMERIHPVHEFAIQGVYDPLTERVFIIANNCDIEEVERVILHEVLAHKGLRKVLGDKFSSLLYDVYKDMSPGTIDEIAKLYNSSSPYIIAEEYIAFLAENYSRPSFLNRTLSRIRNVIREVFGIKYSRNDILYMLSRAEDYYIKSERIPTKEEVTAGEYISDIESWNSIGKYVNNRDLSVQRWFENGGMINEDGTAKVFFYLNNPSANSARNHANVPIVLSSSGIDIEGYIPGTTQMTAAYVRAKNTLDIFNIEQVSLFIQENNLDATIAEKLLGGDVSIYENEKVIQALKNSGFDSVSLLRDGDGKFVSISSHDTMTAFWDDGTFGLLDFTPRLKLKGENIAPHPAQLKKVGDDTREKYQDRMITVKRLTQEVATRAGIEEIPWWMDAYGQENRSHGRIHNATKNMHENLVTPILRSIASVVDVQNEEALSGLKRYLKAKHAPERNERLSKAAGLNTIENKSGFTNDEAHAIISQFEANIPAEEIEILWNRINALSRFVLDRWINDGFISKSHYDNLVSPDIGYKYYVPLKGFHEELDTVIQAEAKQLFKATTPVSVAEGRITESDDPILELINMANTSIALGEKNRVNQYLYRMIQKYPNPDLYHIKKLYYIRTDIKDATERYIYIAQEEVPSEELYADNRVFTKYDKGRMSAQMPPEAPYRVKVFIDGEPKMMHMENPAVASAINGTNKVLLPENSIISEVVKVFGKGTRALSQYFTTKNPAFVAVNTVRDILYASMANGIRGGAYSGAQFLAFIPKANAGISDYEKWNNAQKDLSLAKTLEDKDKASEKMKKYDTEEKRLYERFLDAGGGTGFSFLNDRESLAKDIEKEFKLARRAEHGNRYIFNDDGYIRLWKKSGDVLSLMTQRTESWSRLATFMLAVSKGKSDAVAASEAKNVTVNFDRKGTQSPTIGSFFAFFNAAIQGGENIARIAKDHPKPFIAISALYYALGVSLALLSHGNDDEEEQELYANLSKHLKHNNIIIPLGNTRYLSLPLPFGWRFFYGMGVATVERMVASKNPDTAGLAFDLATGIISATSAINPLTSVQEGEITLTGVTRTVTPTILVPWVDIAQNRDFAGRKIASEPFTRAQDNLMADAGLHSDNVNPLLKSITDRLFVWGGGDLNTYTNLSLRGGELVPINKNLDFNPSHLEHLIVYYLGGRGAFFNDVLKSSVALVDGMTEISTSPANEQFNVNNIPLLDRFYRQSGIRTEYQWFYETKRNLDAYATIKNLMPLEQRLRSVNPHLEMMRDMLNDTDRQLRELRDLRENPMILVTPEKIQEIRNHELELIRELKSQMGVE